MNQVIVEIAGHQYELKEGDVIDVDYQKDWGENKVVNLDKVLSYISGSEVSVGQPYLNNIEIKAKVIKHFKGPKTTEVHFKAKSRYRRKVGFRHHLTRLTITKIAVKKSSTKLKKSK